MVAKGQALGKSQKSDTDAKKSTTPIKRNDAATSNDLDPKTLGTHLGERLRHTSYQSSGPDIEALGFRGSLVAASEMRANSMARYDSG